MALHVKQQQSAITQLGEERDNSQRLLVDFQSRTTDVNDQSHQQIAELQCRLDVSLAEQQQQTALFTKMKQTHQAEKEKQRNLNDSQLNATENKLQQARKEYQAVYEQVSDLQQRLDDSFNRQKTEQRQHELALQKISELQKNMKSEAIRKLKNTEQVTNLQRELSSASETRRAAELQHRQDLQHIQKEHENRLEQIYVQHADEEERELNGRQHFLKHEKQEWQDYKETVQRDVGIQCKHSKAETERECAVLRKENETL